MPLDHFDSAVNVAHLVCVVDTVVVETPDENIAQVVKRGVYAFTSLKDARRFTTFINSCMPTNEPVAFRFKRETEIGEENNGK